MVALTAGVNHAAATYSHQRRTQLVQTCHSATHRRNVQCSASSSIVLQQGPTSMTLTLSPRQMEQVMGAVGDMRRIFTEKQEYEQGNGGQRPKRWPSVDVCISDEDGDGDVLLTMEVFCNPNAHMNAFEARVLVTVDFHAAETATRCQGVRVMTEIGLQEFHQAVTGAVCEN
jgi:hypothetical protein